MGINNVVSQVTADVVRWVLLFLLIAFAAWSGLSTWITWRNWRSMSPGKGQRRTGWICLIFTFLLLAGVFDILLTYYRIGKSMSYYLFGLYLGQTIVYVLMVAAATGFMASLFGWTLRRNDD